jgi:nitroimidazol reductase NimA-like FMN-containing flavoprotein (pyridoxamine 5'-phosphate oxidase superfamily)
VDRLSYTGQAPPLTAKEIESLLKKNIIARICTHNKDGTIHAAPVSYEYGNGQIVILSYASSLKTRNIKRNNNVTVLIDTETVQGVLIYGKAELGHDNVYQLAVSMWEKAFRAPKDKIERLVKAYLGKVEFVIIKITPQRIVTFDYTKDDVYNSLIKTYLG